MSDTAARDFSHDQIDMVEDDTNTAREIVMDIVRRAISSVDELGGVDNLMPFVALGVVEGIKDDDGNVIVQSLTDLTTDVVRRNAEAIKKFHASQV